MRRSFPLLLLPTLLGCSLRVLAVRGTAGVLDAGLPAFHEESDLALAKEALPGQLKLLEVLLQSDPANPRLLRALGEGFVGYAFLFVEDEAPERALGLYRRALGYALRLAALNPKLAGLDALEPQALEAALKHARVRDVPGLYWAGYAWSGWANLAKDDPEALLGAPKAARAMARARELDPGFQFSGADVFFGVYDCARPRVAGGDPERGRKSFEAALERTGRAYLMNLLLYAQHCAVAELDEDLFKRLNEEIQAAPAGRLPSARLADEAAKAKSKKLLEKIHELF